MIVLALSLPSLCHSIMSMFSLFQLIVLFLSLQSRFFNLNIFSLHVTVRQSNQKFYTINYNMIEKLLINLTEYWYRKLILSTRNIFVISKRSSWNTLCLTDLAEFEICNFKSFEKKHFKIDQCWNIVIPQDMRKKLRVLELHAKISSSFTAFIFKSTHFFRSSTTKVFLFRNVSRRRS